MTMTIRFILSVVMSLVAIIPFIIFFDQIPELFQGVFIGAVVTLIVIYIYENLPFLMKLKNFIEEYDERNGKKK